MPSLRYAPCGAVLRPMSSAAEPPLLCTAAHSRWTAACAVVRLGRAWRLNPQVWASIVKNGCMILQNRGFAKETLLHKHEAHTALRTELKRAQVRL